MRILLFIIFLTFCGNICCGQSTIEWSSDRNLRLSDFESETSEINKELNTYAIYSGVQMDFLFQMSNYEFMFTKNFNSKVRTVFNKNSASIIAPDSIIANQLLMVGQYDFDLAELYSRKFRKELYEQKGTFSNVSFFKPIYEKLQAEMSQVNAQVFKDSELGKNSEILEKEHQKVREEIELLSDFCKECKPPKKKKNKSK